ncbi:MAG: molybdenum ABC transporter ATP-binding protein [Cohaesibacter sp.]|jgi:molybdate transport system ATP-binding protein|nr:molybdenum ABC transporter ATP-binding protein [Cohaesibacter sp.]
MSLSVSINHKAGDFDLDLAFDLEAGGLTALFGPSGAGKSLAINAIAGLITPQEGHIELDGKLLYCSKKGINIPTHRRKIAYMFQDSRLFPHMTISKNLLFGAKRCTSPPTQDEIDTLTKLLDITHLLDRYPAHLSGGEKQRVALGRALLSNPSLILLDEPLAALDQGRKREILPHLERLRDESNIPILYVSHSISEVTRLADHLVLLNQGKVAAQGSVHDVMNRLDLFPLTGRFEAGTAFPATILAQDSENGMTEVQFDGGTLWLTSLAGNIDEAIRLRIRARDVMLATIKPEAISANNILPVNIEDWRMDANQHVDIQLSCGAIKLMARITTKSWKRLKLGKGSKLFAIIKSVSLDRRLGNQPRIQPHNTHDKH